MDFYKELGHNLIKKIFSINYLYVCINCRMEVFTDNLDEFVFANGKYYKFTTPKCSEIIMENILR